MLKDMIIVQTAASAFNNAALAAPAFLWWAILALPLFWITRICATPILTQLNWTHENITQRATLITVLLSLAWTIMFGGDYSILRDGTSALPWLIASILFVGTMFIASHTHDKINMSRGRKWTIFAIILVCIALSGTHAWWGPILQCGAVIMGALFGKMARCPMRPIAGTLLIILTITTAIMMQPEFFRFGKLGNLSMIHLLFVLLTGVAAVATLILNNINPRGRVHRSAYIKLKWMMRFGVALAVALTFLTESVPVFLGTLLAFGFMFALSVWHRDNIAPDLVSRMFAITIGLFGIITTMPVITCVAILYWIAVATTNTLRDAKFLL